MNLNYDGSDPKAVITGLVAVATEMAVMTYWDRNWDQLQEGMDNANQTLAKNLQNLLDTSLNEVAQWNPPEGSRSNRLVRPLGIGEGIALYPMVSCSAELTANQANHNYGLNVSIRLGGLVYLIKYKLYGKNAYARQDVSCKQLSLTDGQWRNA